MRCLLSPRQSQWAAPSPHARVAIVQQGLLPLLKYLPKPMTEFSLNKTQLRSSLRDLCCVKEMVSFSLGFIVRVLFNPPRNIVCKKGPFNDHSKFPGRPGNLEYLLSRNNCTRTVIYTKQLLCHKLTEPNERIAGCTPVSVVTLPLLSNRVWDRTLILWGMGL